MPRGSREPGGRAAPAGPCLHKQLSCTTCLARAGELGWKNLLPVAVGERAWHGALCPPAAASQLLSCLLGDSQRFPNPIFVWTGCLQHLPSPRRGEDLCLTCLNKEDIKPQRIGFSSREQCQLLSEQSWTLDVLRGSGRCPGADQTFLISRPPPN